MYVNSIYFMYNDVQYIEVSIILIVNLFLELIYDRFHIDVFVFFCLLTVLTWNFYSINRNK